MNTKDFPFKIGDKIISIKLKEPIPNMLLVEICSPWSTRKMATQVRVKDFIADIESLLPSELVDQDDQMPILLPKLIETLKKHIAKYGRIADADFSTYANYLALIYQAIITKLNRGSLTEKNIIDLVTNLAGITEKLFFKIERTQFSKL